MIYDVFLFIMKFVKTTFNIKSKMICLLFKLLFSIG